MQVPDLREALKQQQDSLRRVDRHNLADLEPVCPCPLPLHFHSNSAMGATHCTLRCGRAAATSSDGTGVVPPGRRRVPAPDEGRLPVRQPGRPRGFPELDLWCPNFKGVRLKKRFCTRSLPPPPYMYVARRLSPARAREREARASRRAPRGASGYTALHQALQGELTIVRPWLVIYHPYTIANRILYFYSTKGEGRAKRHPCGVSRADLSRPMTVSASAGKLPTADTAGGFK